MDEDLKVSQRYRELATEEPPRALDDAILAAARDAQRPWTRRYAVPIGVAAVVVLSVTVTLRIQHEEPGLEVPAPAPAAKAPAQVAQAEAPMKLKVETDIKPPAPERRAKPALADEAKRDRARQDEPKPFAQPLREQAKESVVASAPPAAAPAAPAPAAAAMASRAEIARGTESSVAGAAARQAEERTARDAAAAARAPQAGPVEALAKRAALGSVTTPEQELERIALLRREGKHDEADKALAEFRKRLPDYRIAEDMLRRVERR